MVDIWDCGGSAEGSVPGAQELWYWDSDSEGVLRNRASGKCLTVFSAEPQSLRVDQGDDSAPAGCSRWSWNESSGQLTTSDARSRGSGAKETVLCLLVDGEVTGRDADHNYTVPAWQDASSDDTEWNSFAGKANGAHVTVGDCDEAGVRADRACGWGGRCG